MFKRIFVPVGRTGLEKVLLGSETQKVLAHTRLPVVVVR